MCAKVRVLSMAVRGERHECTDGAHLLRRPTRIGGSDVVRRSLPVQNSPQRHEFV